MESPAWSDGSDSPRQLLEQIYRGALDAVAPEPVVRCAVEALPIDPGQRIRLLALGKAAVPMITAATQALADRGAPPYDGLAVTVDGATAADLPFDVVAGDHPVPAGRSFQAAERIGTFARAGRPGDLVIVLLSGGTSSLIAAPVAPVTDAELIALYDLLLRSGLPIGAMNRVRRRVARWGGGRLAVALAPARIELLAISDVPGDDPVAIGSGPCAPDPDTANAIRSLLLDRNLWTRVPTGVRALIDATLSGRVPETPGPDDAVFTTVATRIVAANRDAVAGAVTTAQRLGFMATARPEPLTGEAAELGAAIAHALLSARRAAGPRCLVWGGEPTVTLPPGATPPGGRCQELALAAAQVLRDATGPWPALLAAGTDGRDGHSPAGGGCVDPRTWRRIAEAGRDPAADLARHDNHAALAAAGATLVTGPTGTNVMDLVIGLTGPAAMG